MAARRIWQVKQRFVIVLLLYHTIDILMKAILFAVMLLFRIEILKHLVFTHVDYTLIGLNLPLCPKVFEK